MTPRAKRWLLWLAAINAAGALVEIAVDAPVHVAGVLLWVLAVVCVYAYIARTAWRRVR